MSDDFKLGRFVRFKDSGFVGGYGFGLIIDNDVILKVQRVYNYQYPAVWLDEIIIKNKADCEIICIKNG